MVFVNSANFASDLVILCFDLSTKSNLSLRKAAQPHSHSTLSWCMYHRSYTTFDDVPSSAEPVKWIG